MFCPNCGKELPDGVKFCPSCGKPIVDKKQDYTTQDTLKDSTISVRESNNAQEKSSTMTSTKQTSHSKMIIGIGIALALVVILAGILAIRFSIRSSLKDFDYAGVVIGIPDGYETNDFYSNRFDILGTQETISFEDSKNSDNAIQIMYFPGEWVPDDNGELTANFPQNDSVETIDEKCFSIDNIEIRYGHYKTDYLGKTIYANAMSVFFEDRWVNILTNAYDNQFDKEMEKVINSVRISKNQYNFYGFDVTNASDIVPILEQSPKQESTPPASTKESEKVPNSESSKEPVISYHEYNINDRIIIPIPDVFVINEEDSGESDTYFDSTIDGNEVMVISIFEKVRNIDEFTPDNFEPYYGIKDYDQDIFSVSDHMVKTHLTYTLADQDYEEYDIIVAENKYDKYYLAINIRGFVDDHHDYFQFIVDNITVEGREDPVVTAPSYGNEETADETDRILRDFSGSYYDDYGNYLFVGADGLGRARASIYSAAGSELSVVLTNYGMNDFGNYASGNDYQLTVGSVPSCDIEMGFYDSDPDILTVRVLYLEVEQEVGYDFYRTDPSNVPYTNPYN